MATKKTNKGQPKIELYMYSLNQEFPVKKGHESFLKRLTEVKPDVSGKLTKVATVESQVYNLKDKIANDWSAQWVSNQWIENHTQAAGVGIREYGDPMLTAILREEDFGAILFEPGSDRVFKLNREGAELFNAVRKQYVQTEGKWTQQGLAGFSVEQVTLFVDYLKAAGLWLPS